MNEQELKKLIEENVATQVRDLFGAQFVEVNETLEFLAAELARIGQQLERNVLKTDI